MAQPAEFLAREQGQKSARIPGV